MMGSAYAYLTGGYFMGDQECYTIRYRTRKQRSDKFRFFTTLGEAVKWAKRRRGEIIPIDGSWQILRTLDGEPLDQSASPALDESAIPKYLMCRQ